MKLKQSEILYEEGNDFPFVKLDKDDEMPSMLFIAELRDTGETEEENNQEFPVFDWEPHQYISSSFMKKHLDEETYNKIRKSLGLKPLKEAIEDGRNISEKVRENIKISEENRKLNKEKDFENAQDLN